MRKNGAATEYLFLTAIAIAAGIRTAAARHAPETSATQAAENGVRIAYGKQDQIHNTAPDAAILTTAAQYAKAIFAIITIRDGAQTAHGLL